MFFFFLFFGLVLILCLEKVNCFRKGLETGIFFVERED